MSREVEIARKRAEQQKARIEAAQLKDVAALLDHVEFRRYVRRYLDRCNVFMSTFTGTSETFFKEGQRSIGTTIFGEVMLVGPQRFAQLMAEPMPEDIEPEVVDED